MKETRPIYVILIQFAVVVCALLMMPLMIYVFTGDFEESKWSLISVMPAMTVSFIIFMLNYWWLVPVLYFRRKRLLFFLMNLFLYLLILLLFCLVWSNTTEEDSVNIIMMASAFFINLMFIIGASALALALRNSLRNRILREQIMEEKRRHTEDELIWLKNQLNPHFLFNTLNNISALVNIDADMAQDCISRLSDLLRYAMYETSKQFVPLFKEAEFMKDYISLMQLRCNDKTTVNVEFDLESNNVKIAPLLLISLIENAFKHGVSSNLHSEISIFLKERAELLTFECINTNHAKGSSDNSGSGIGLVNTERRLELLYPGRFKWNQESEKGLFKIRVEINL